MSDNHEETHEHMGIGKYLLIFGILFFCTILTYYTALTDLDSMLFAGANTLLALIIAFFKMTLVILFFMHVWWNGTLIKLTAVGSFFWMAIMFAFVMQDYLTRGFGVFGK
jgi:cytochrome c oxidase subunit IV